MEFPIILHKKLIALFVVSWNKHLWSLIIALWARPWCSGFKKDQMKSLGLCVLFYSSYFWSTSFCVKIILLFYQPMAFLIPSLVKSVIILLSASLTTQFAKSMYSTTSKTSSSKFMENGITMAMNIPEEWRISFSLTSYGITSASFSMNTMFV